MTRDGRIRSRAAQRIRELQTLRDETPVFTRRHKLDGEIEGIKTVLGYMDFEDRLATDQDNSEGLLD